MKLSGRIVLIFIFLLSGFGHLHAQYFGQNKVKYDDFDPKVLETNHFNIHYFLHDTTRMDEFGQMGERWFLRHQALFADTFTNKVPMIIYDNHADFQQTTITGGIIGVGTGGFTEGYRNRVVMPLTVSNKGTSHVLGHEMVHAFQYNMFKSDPRISLRNIQNVPLWMIEGMAEYLSIGRTDAHTAMWMRDAVLYDDIPTFKEMTRKPNKYFPYRYGHAIWAFMGGTWGDGIVKALLRQTAIKGIKGATDTLLNLDTDTLSRLWEKSLKKTYKPYMKDTIATVGKDLFFKDKKGGKINISPVISPDGKYMIFLSDKNVITIDVFLADLEKNKIIKSLTASTRSSQIDQYNYLESAGTWAPDSKKFAMTAFVKGKNKLIIIDAQKGDKIEEHYIPGLESFKNPTWSPDGKSIVVSGLKNGRSDLYQYILKTGEVTRLTNDPYADIHPSWSSDGTHIVFASDRGPLTDFESLKYGPFQISIINTKTKQIAETRVFPQADNLNPHFSPANKKIYFLSNADGFRNLYEYHIETGETYKLTKYFTGISGITETSPAFSISPQTDELVYTIYRNKKYNLYKANSSDFPRFEVDPKTVNMTAAELPPTGAKARDIVIRENLRRSPGMNTDEFDREKYTPKLTLETIAAGGAGVGVSSFGTMAQGGVSFLFSDMMKENQIFATAMVQGEIYDLGGQVTYLNQENRISWGAGVSHIPYRSSYAFLTADTLEPGDKKVPVTNLVYRNYRIFVDRLSIFGYYPLSRNLRFEGNVSAMRYGFRIDQINNYYSDGIFIGTDREKLDGPDPFYLGQASVAFVGDDSNFGYTGPLGGYRYRFEIEKMVGKYDTWGLLGDVRRYFFAKPVSFALRAMTYGRYGESANDLYPIFIGDPYMQLVRGYSYNTFQENQTLEGGDLNIEQLVGSRVAVANAEVRLPFTGIQRLSVIKSGFLYSDLILFADAGLAWTKGDDIKFSWKPANWEPSDNDSRAISQSHYSSGEITRSPVVSAGASLRINLFGYLILEPYVAMPFQKQNVDYTFGLILSGGGW